MAWKRLSGRSAKPSNLSRYASIAVHRCQKPRLVSKLIKDNQKLNLSLLALDFTLFKHHHLRYLLLNDDLSRSLLPNYLASYPTGFCRLALLGGRRNILEHFGAGIFAEILETTALANNT